MVTVGRYIEGISLNGLEWLLNDNGKEMVFPDKSHAIGFLQDNGYKDFSQDDFDDNFVFEVRTWEKFYRDRVNSGYQEKFEKRYKPFLGFILSLKEESLYEVGCGIGSVSKALHTKMRCSGFDASDDMVHLAIENNKHWASLDNFHVDNLFRIGELVNFCVTHGVLEHWTDKMIVTAIEKMPYSVHYVPLDKYETPSFGDERLLPKEHWINLVQPTSWFTFNDDHDLCFYINRLK